MNQLDQDSTVPRLPGFLQRLFGSVLNEGKPVTVELTEFAPGCFTAAQLTPDDLDAVLARGIRSVVNNRPDGESVDQPGNAVLEARARTLGINWRYAPIQTRTPTASELDAFQQALKELERPVLAFCRTGTRSSIGLSALGTQARRDNG